MLENNSIDYSKQDGYYGSKEDYYDENGNCYNFICNSFFENRKIENKDIKFNLSDEKRAILEKEINEYFKEKTHKELDNKDFSVIFDFMVDNLISEVYNEGVVDACIYIIKQVKSLLEIRK